ncbi:sigma-70 family RNA polymerase sigma factor [Paenibacillus donghaensis]|uniref:sigma-70 family RNA polymerase sigma factor n=1 Tax=Paenibacillus donghaensis TaxID=414771 RepID=UPI001883B542|nr:sigma-70 family RNA polymerase sigma factor [Paenibacillus donghaensis]MBE9916355.1 sigma-70 family RNA polymerase sigma factor [Paenibacillus donghaensis]
MAADLKFRGLNKDELIAVSTYWEKNKKILRNPVVRGFFENQGNMELLARQLTSPTPEASQMFEAAFRRYFFRIRFTKYLSSLIKFCDIDYHRKRTLQEQRHPLVLDRPVDDGESTLGEFMYSISTVLEEDTFLSDPAKFQYSFDNEALFHAFNRLTDKQKLIITLAYSTCAMDKEIADLLHISQQAITKTRLTALRKMKKYITDRQLEYQLNRKEGNGLTWKIHS